MITTLKPLLIIKTKVATGTANAIAAPGSPPVLITKLVPIIDPDTISGGQLAPTGKAPNQTNSNVAPVIIPSLKSPKTNPTNGPMMIGLLYIKLPKPSCANPIAATNVINNVSVNKSIFFSS